MTCDAAIRRVPCLEEAAQAERQAARASESLRIPGPRRLDQHLPIAHGLGPSPHRTCRWGSTYGNQ
jgi:hypothetical protein